MKIIYTIVASLLIGATIIVFLQREEDEKSTVPVSQGINGLPASSSDQGAGLNPAHGQPGHRCELPVGAPLTSTPAASTASPAQVNPTPPTQSTPAATSNAPAGVTKNPEHGMPGHRCDLAVGAPL